VGFVFTANMISRTLLLVWGLASIAYGNLISRQSSNSSLGSCPGYKASNIEDDGSTFTADLTLAGKPCNVYGRDLVDLKLEVEYQTG
jgi:alpha-glucosidase